MTSLSVEISKSENLKTRRFRATHHRTAHIDSSELYGETGLRPLKGEPGRLVGGGREWELAHTWNCNTWETETGGLGQVVDQAYNMKLEKKKVPNEFKF